MDFKQNLIAVVAEMQEGLQTQGELDSKYLGELEFLVKAAAKLVGKAHTYLDLRKPLHRACVPSQGCKDWALIDGSWVLRTWSSETTEVKLRESAEGLGKSKMIY